MARGLVEVEVDRDHEVEPRQRALEPRAVGRRQHRVAGDRDQRADLARRPASRSPRRASTTGSSPPNSGSPRTRLRQRAKCPRPPPSSARRPGRPPAGEHRAAPRSRLPVTTLSTLTASWRARRTPAWTRRCARSRRPLGAPRTRARAGEWCRRRCRYAGRRARARSAATAVARAPSTPRPRAGPAARSPSANRITCEHREQQQRVAARADEEVLAAELRGLGAPRIEDDHLAAARLDRLEPRRTSGAVIRLPFDASGLAPSIRKYRCGRVGHRQQELVAEHQHAASMCGSWSTEVAENVVARAERLDAAPARTSSEAEVVHRRIALVRADRVAPCACRGSRAAARRPIERLVPADRGCQLVAAAAQPGGAADPDRRADRRARRPSGRCSRG